MQVPRQYINNHDVRLLANISDAEGIMALALVNDAIRRLSPTSVSLSLGYVPYARQDRVCNPGEALSIKVFCDMINFMNFDKVFILDPHSDVTPALLNNCIIREPATILSSSTLIRDLMDGKVTLVAPDAGATKKVEKVAQHFGGLEVIQGFKKRDLATGALSGFGYIGDVVGKDLLIVDDICDGGGTFLGLATKLYDGGAKSIELYVSHGIFSKGIDCLLDTCFERIYTTNSFDHGNTGDRLEIIDWS